jgi:hypothetical protein
MLVRLKEMKTNRINRKSQLVLNQVKASLLQHTLEG